MKIASVTNQSLYKQTSFGSMGYSYGEYWDMYGIKRETQHTTQKRGDICLEDFAKLLQKRFEKFDRVNIMPMNVSDGTEAYLFANAIIRNEGLETFKKKYSIKASDVIAKVIDRYPRSGLLHLYSEEVKEFEGLGIDILEEVNIKDYENKLVRQVIRPNRLFKLSDEYRKYFDFSVADLQKRVEYLNDEGNSVIAIRNCLRQSFGSLQSATIIRILASKMKGASLFITGDYDRGLTIIDDTLKSCFVELKHNIWGLKGYGRVDSAMSKYLYRII